MLNASHTPSDPTELKVPRYLQLSQWVSSNGLIKKKSLSYLSLVQELEDSCPVCVRPYNHGTSWDSGQVAGSPLCYISRAAVAAQKLEVLGAELLGPSRKSSSISIFRHGAVLHKSNFSGTFSQTPESPTVVIVLLL